MSMLLQVHLSPCGWLLTVQAPRRSSLRMCARGGSQEVDPAGLIVRLYYPANRLRPVHPAPYKPTTWKGYRRSEWYEPLPAPPAVGEVGKSSRIAHTVVPPRRPRSRLPDYRYATAYGDFVRLPRALSYLVVVPMLAPVTLTDAFAEAPLLSLEIEAAVQPRPDPRRRLPVLVFSHGLGGMRTTYSGICSELASHGWVVAAVEHADRSASLSLRRGGTYAIPYFAAPTTGEESMRLRAAQVKRRIDEVFWFAATRARRMPRPRSAQPAYCLPFSATDESWRGCDGRAVELMRRLDAGTPIARVEPTKAKAEPKLDLSSFRGRLDLARQAVAGNGSHASTVTGYVLARVALTYWSASVLLLSAHLRA